MLSIVPGEYEVVVYIFGNMGISAYHLTMDFDNTRFTPVSITEGSQFNTDANFLSNLKLLDESEIAELDNVSASWISLTNNYSDGTLFTVLFRANPEMYLEGDSELKVVTLSSYAMISTSLSTARSNEFTINDVATNLCFGSYTAEFDLFEVYAR